VVEVVVAGAGIVGLATAYELTRRGHGVTVLEKESEIAQHQTGRNSGVIHSGLYYAPGSLKARLGTAGAASMRDFAVEHGVPVEICGKLVVASHNAGKVREITALIEPLGLKAISAAELNLPEPEETGATFV